MAKSSKGASLVFLQSTVAAFFILFGLAAIVNYDSKLNRFGREVVRTFGGSNDPLTLIIAILAVVAGVILLAGLILSVSSRLMYLAAVATLVYWALRILYVFVFNNIFEPDFLVWLADLSPEAILLAALLLIARKYS